MIIQICQVVVNLPACSLNRIRSRCRVTTDGLLDPWPLWCHVQATYVSPCGYSLRGDRLSEPSPWFNYHNICAYTTHAHVSMWCPLIQPERQNRGELSFTPSPHFFVFPLRGWTVHTSHQTFWAKDRHSSAQRSGVRCLIWTLFEG